MKRKIIPIVVVASALGILFDMFFFDKPLGISVLLYLGLTLGGALLLAIEFHHRLNKATLALMAVILFLAGMLAVRSSGMLIFLNLAAILYLMLLIVKLTNRPQISLTDYPLSGYFFGLPRLPLRILSSGTGEIRALIRSYPPRSMGAYRPIIRGILLALPILFVFLLLLSSADPIFQKYLSSLFDFNVNGELLVRIFLVGLVTTALSGAYALLFMREPIQDPPARLQSDKLGLGATETTIILGSVSVLFLIFLLVQATYLFGGSDRVLSTGLTYAEYARRGFFELIAVATISMAMLLVLKKTALLPAARDTRRFAWLSAFLVAEVLIIMFSAHQRLSLYEQAYGFTQLRLFSHVFIVWLAAALIMLALYILRAQRESRFALSLFISVLAFMAVMNLINPDRLIARQNIDRYQQTGKIDGFYLNELSEDATPELIRLLDDRRVVDKTRIDYHLYWQKQRIDCEYDAWQSANLSRHAASDLLAKNAAKLISPPKESFSTRCADESR
jgi:Domain of unknown function (DUF4173)